MAASSLSRSQGPLGAYSRKMKRKLDNAQVVPAVAHKLARILYSMLRNGTAYCPDLHVIDPQHKRQKEIKRIQKNAKVLGFAIVDLTTGEIVDHAA